MNLGAPAQCSGIVTAWHFCYGVSECEMDTKYHATFLVYRPSKNHTSGELLVVPESIRSVSLAMECGNKRRVKCSKEMLSSEKQFIVEENDILAVCLPAESEQQLQIISRNTMKTMKEVAYISIVMLCLRIVSLI